MAETVYHSPVLAEEVAEALRHLSDDFLLVDATLGEGGHSALLLEQFPRMRLVGVDADAEIMEVAQRRLQQFADRVTFFRMWNDDFFFDIRFVQRAYCSI